MVNREDLTMSGYELFGQWIGLLMFMKNEMFNQKNGHQQLKYTDFEILWNSRESKVFHTRVVANKLAALQGGDTVAALHATQRDGHPTLETANLGQGKLVA